MNFEIDQKTRDELEAAAAIGREHMRPLGIEADHKREPIAVGHPFFDLMWKRSLEKRSGRKDTDAAGTPVRARRSMLLGEEMSYWDRGVCVALPGPGLGGPPLMSMGTPEQKERYLLPFRDPSRPRWGAFAMTEPSAGSDVAAIQTTATKDGNTWILNGAKSFCSNALRADWILVWATVDRSLGRAGHRAFVVEAGAEGVLDMRHEHKMGLCAYDSSSFRLENCRVASDQLIGGEDHYAAKAGFRGAMKAFNATRPMIAANAIGIVRAAYDAARDFARENYELDRPIPRYQRMTEKLGRMARKLEMGRLLCWRSAHLADLKKPNQVEASMAKAFAATMGQEVTGLAVEILQDVGVTRAGYVEKLYRDIKAMDIVEGTGQIQRVVMARNLLDLPREGS